MIKIEFCNIADVRQSHVFDSFSDFSREPNEGLLPGASFILEPVETISIDAKYSCVAVIKDYIFFKFNTSYLILYKQSDEPIILLETDLDFYNIYILYKSSLQPWETYRLLFPMHLIYRYRCVNSGAMMIHSASVLHNDEMILFCGVSGAGKSTQANLWKKYVSARVINYDKNAIIVKGSCVYGQGSPWTGKEGVSANIYRRLKCIVFVQQDKHDELRQLSLSEAFSTILLNNYLYPLSDEIESRYFDIIHEIVNYVPVYILSCTISKNAVSVLYEELYRTGLN